MSASFFLYSAGKPFCPPACLLAAAASITPGTRVTYCENSNNHPTDMDVADAQFEAGHVKDEVAERCYGRRGSRPSWRSGETTGNQLKYLEPAKELVKHVECGPAFCAGKRVDNYINRHTHQYHWSGPIQSTQSWYMAPSSAWTTKPQCRGWRSSISTPSQPPVGVLQQQELLFHVGHQQVQVKRPSCVDHRGIK